jgi:hypothetical protein
VLKGALNTITLTLMLHVSNTIAQGHPGIL